MSTPKFLMGGVRFKQNFFGLGTCQAALYMVIEGAIKIIPYTIGLFVIGFASRPYSHSRRMVQEKDVKPMQLR